MKYKLLKPSYAVHHSLLLMQVLWPTLALALALALALLALALAKWLRRPWANHRSPAIHGCLLWSTILLDKCSRISCALYSLIDPPHMALRV